MDITLVLGLVAMRGQASGVNKAVGCGVAPLMNKPVTERVERVDVLLPVLAPIRRKLSAGSRVCSGAHRLVGRVCVRRQCWPSLRTPDTTGSRTDLTRPYILPCSTDKVDSLLGNSLCRFGTAFPLPTTAIQRRTAQEMWAVFHEPP